MPIEYEPLEMLVGEVTVRLAELLAPGERERAELLHIPTQPLGRLAFKLKFAVVQAELSLSVTLTAKATNGVVRGERGKGKLLNPVAAASREGPSTGKMSKPFADPRFWAAFILIGDPN